MSIEAELKKLNTALSELRDAIVGAAGSGTTAPKAPDKPEKPAKPAASKPAKDKPAKDKPAKDKPATDPWGDTPPEKPAKEPAKPAAPASDSDFDPDSKTAKKQLTEAFIELAKDKGREVAMNLLAKYNAEALPALPKEQWAAFYAEVEALSK